MQNLTEFAPLIISIVSLIIAIWAILTRRKAAIPINNIEHPETVLHQALHELHEKSKPSAGKLHLHDVEEVLIRRFK